MSSKMTLRLPFKRKEIAGKFAFAFISDEALGNAMQNAAVQLEASAQPQFSELSYHKGRLERMGTGDPEVAASLLLLLEGAETVVLIASKMLRFGAIRKGEEEAQK